MPNQLAASKRRKSLAEHRAVLAALDVIARREGTTVTALLRQAGRELVRKHALVPEQAQAIRAAVWAFAPQMPSRFRTAAQLARFKRRRREFEQLVLDLQAVEPSVIQARNTAIPPGCEIRILGLHPHHATTDL